MIDPIHSLAFSIQANPGVYALLLGSGVSRAAGIPTGWEITLDLVRKLAALHKENAEPDPEHWYRDKFGKEANYSNLLDALAKEQAERQQLLRPYFEPNEQERDGAKQPTAAHRAIAKLVAQEGFIKVIITTNFDRLIEKALEDAGVVPTVLSSPDHVEGAPPLIHTQCCVFKVHGDYLDIRIRNTSAELATYPCQFNQLLDRIIDEFGLIVCGWSADWDGALRTAILRAPSRRFTTYWAARGEPNHKAQHLIQHRAAQVIPIADADTFFQDVQEYVQSLEEFSRPHLLSTEAAVASLKRYLSEPRRQIQLADLIDEVVDQVVEATSTTDFATQGGPTSGKEDLELARRYEAACSTLLAMALVGGFWAEEGHYDIWGRALERLVLGSTRSGHSHNLKGYPGALLLYALGLGALKANRLQFIGYIFKSPFTVSLHQSISPSNKNGFPLGPFVDGKEMFDQPLKHQLYTNLRQHTKRLIPNPDQYTLIPDQYTLIFDKLEILLALSYAHPIPQSMSLPHQYQFPIGTFFYRERNREWIFQEIQNSLDSFQNESPFVKSGIFGETAEVCMQILAALHEFVRKCINHWRR